MFEHNEQRLATKPMANELLAGTVIVRNMVLPPDLRKEYRPDPQAETSLPPGFENRLRSRLGLRQQIDQGEL